MLSRIDTCHENLQELQQKHFLEVQTSNEEKITYHTLVSKLEEQKKVYEVLRNKFKEMNFNLEEMNADKHLREKLNELESICQEEKSRKNKILNSINQETNDKEIVIQQRSHFDIIKRKEIQDLEGIIGEKNLIYQTMADEEKADDSERRNLEQQKESSLRHLVQVDNEIEKLMSINNENEKDFENKSKEIQKCKEEIERAKKILEKKILQNADINLGDEEKKLQNSKESKLKEYQKKLKNQTDNEKKTKKKSSNDLFEEL